MSVINFISYSIASESVRNLQQALNSTYTVRRYGPDSKAVISLKNKGFQKENPAPVINIKWGNVKGLPKPPESKANTLCVNFTDMEPYVNKLEFFKKFGNLTPSFWVDGNAVQEYLNSGPVTEHPLIVERNSLYGHSGEGIRLLKGGDSVNSDCKLWVKYVKKQDEFRIHFIRYEDNWQFYYQKKKLRINPENSPVVPNRFQVRNHQNGWIYSTDIVTIPDKVREIASKFVEHQQNTLDFGCIDIIYNKQGDTAYILEVNTAPGLAGRTLSFYKDGFRYMMECHDWSNRKTTFKFVEPPAVTVEEEEVHTDWNELADEDNE